MEIVLYIHGKGGNAAESDHFRPLFPGGEVIGLEYQGDTPWETGKEIRAATEALTERGADIVLIANSVGAYFSMNAGIGGLLREAHFISPIVDMERLISDRMTQAKVTEAELEARGTIPTGWGGDLSWKYLSYVRRHPLIWEVPTRILYGQNDHLTSLATIRRFAREHGADLTVMENGPHWFHTEEQMRFLDGWICAGRRSREMP